VSGGKDGIVRLWDVTSGRLLRSLDQQGCGGITSIAIDPQGRTVICEGRARTLVWDFDNGRLRYELQPEGLSTSLAFAPNGEWFARLHIDCQVDLIDVNSGRVLSSLAGGECDGYSMALDPSGSMLAFGNNSGTIFLWSVSNGQLLRKLEGHTSVIDVLAYSPDGSLLASKSNDQTIRLWNCATWEAVAIIPAPKPTDKWIPALAFLPNKSRRRAVLATASSSPTETTDDQLCREIHLYELDLDVLLRNTSPPDVNNAGESNGRVQSPSEHQTVHSATAKIVLVGDSGVGKTGLGWRLSHGEYREHDSTHGQQFWVLNQLATTRQDGTQCEAVLWDLAGQPDYRLIHALSIQDADLALIVFDPTNGRDPLGSAEYWLRQLPVACPKILVAARIDRGTPVLTDEELDAFCQRVGIAGGCIKTSARENEGVDELLERIKKTIQWDLKTAVSTDAMFKRIKDFVLTLKESRTRKQVLYTPAELRNALVESRSTKRRPGKKHTHKASDIQDSTASLTDVQLLTAVRNLSSQGFVRLVTQSSGEERILLVPELLNNLAASIVLEARRNERGLGLWKKGAYSTEVTASGSSSPCPILIAICC
jgi:small GTP-binding protein